MVLAHGAQSLTLPDPPSAGSPRVARGVSGLPDVFVVGAAKSGTTALYRYFQLHPQVFVPAAIKEANYMAFSDGLPPLTGPGDRQCVGGSATTLADYRRLYRGRGREAAAADVSPAYLYHPRAAARIAELAPEARIVIILRNPVDCVLSMYAMLRGTGREPCRSVWDAFQRSDERLAAGWEWAWDYKNCFKFSAQVARYAGRFRRAQLFIRRYEDLQREPARFYRELTSFLGVPPIDVAQANQRVNAAPRRVDVLRRKRTGRMLCRAGRVVGRLAPSRLAAAVQRRWHAPAFALRPAERRALVEHFGPDVIQLSRMLAWDLSHWLRG